jgi:hypothetical protein
VAGGRAALAAALVLAACSHGGASSSTRTTAAGPTTTAAGAASLPTVATTAIPAGSPSSTAIVGGTSAPVPTTTIPLTPPTSGTPAAPAPAPAPVGSDSAPTPSSPTVSPAPTATPAPTTPPAGNGDPVAFCAAVDRVLPLYLTTLILVDSGDNSDGDARFEVAVAPALAGPVHAAAASAPSIVASPFQRWGARTDAAIATLKGAGATDAQVNSLGTAFAAQVDQATSGGDSQSPPDPVEAAAKAGIDGSRLRAAASAFTAANGDFDTFVATLGQELTLAPGQLADLSARFPCAADLANFSG